MNETEKGWKDASLITKLVIFVICLGIELSFAIWCDFVLTLANVPITILTLFWAGIGVIIGITILFVDCVVVWK